MSFSQDGSYHPAASAVIPELAQVDALPGPQIQPAVRDGKSQFDTDQYRFGMSRHVIISFQHVLIVGFSLLHQPIKD